MKGEIANENYYCVLAINTKDARNLCPVPRKRISTCKEDHSGCPFACHKWPTPKQYKHEYRKEYPDEGAVYIRRYVYWEKPKMYTWIVTDYAHAKDNFDPKKEDIVCACTSFGCPPDWWIPEK